MPALRLLGPPPLVLDDRRERALSARDAAAGHGRRALALAGMVDPWVDEVATAWLEDEDERRAWRECDAVHRALLAPGAPTPESEAAPPAVSLCPCTRSTSG